VQEVDGDGVRWRCLGGNELVSTFEVTESTKRVAKSTHHLGKTHRQAGGGNTMKRGQTQFGLVTNVWVQEHWDSLKMLVRLTGIV